MPRCRSDALRRTRMRRTRPLRASARSKHHGPHAVQVTTLRRNGSDYSATIFGALTRCREICIWTDVDGVYSADPRKVPEAVCLESMSYHEAWELSYFGANVLHPRTTLPAMKYGIPVVIRNFFNLNAPGTSIRDLTEQAPSVKALPVSGFATIEKVALINVEGTGMQGVPGTASSIFASLRDHNINVIMISQARPASTWSSLGAWAWATLCRTCGEPVYLAAGVRDT